MKAAGTANTRGRGEEGAAVVGAEAGLLIAMTAAEDVPQDTAAMRTATDADHATLGGTAERERGAQIEGELEAEKSVDEDRRQEEREDKE